MKFKLTSKLKRVLLTLLVVAVVGGGLGYAWWRQSPYSAHDFDAQVWREGDGDEDHGVLRGRMADDLIENQGLLGRSRADIVELLGDPDATAAGPLLEWHLAWSSLYVRLDGEGNATAVFERTW